MKARHPQGDNLPEVNVSPVERVVSAAAGSYLLFDSIANRGRWGWVKAIAGGLLLHRGTTGYCFAYDLVGKGQLPVPYKTINIRTKLTVNRPRNEVYRFWRQLENLPLFMTHLESVKKIDERFSQWKAKFPGQMVPLEWKAEIVKEKENKFLGWSSTEEASIKNSGKVEFKDALGGQGTEITVVISYHPPLGVVGSGIAQLFNKKLEKLIRKDVQNFKSYIETGVNEKKESSKSASSSKPSSTTTEMVGSAVEGLAEGLSKNPETPAIGQL